jgi:L-asparaginase II
MAATCVINGWPVRGYLDPGHPLQQLVADTIGDLTGEEPAGMSTDGCGTPLFALTLRGMARAFGRLTAAAEAGSGNAEAAVGRAIRNHPEMVAGEGRDVTELMRLVPGLVAKDGFEGVQLVGLPDGRGVAVKISDGGDRARMPVTVRVLDALDVDTSQLAGIATAPVLGGGHQVGLLQAADFLFPEAATPPTPHTSD